MHQARQHCVSSWLYIIHAACTKLILFCSMLSVDKCESRSLHRDSLLFVPDDSQTSLYYNLHADFKDHIFTWLWHLHWSSSGKDMESGLYFQVPKTWKKCELYYYNMHALQCNIKLNVHLYTASKRLAVVVSRGCDGTGGNMYHLSPGYTGHSGWRFHPYYWQRECSKTECKIAKISVL